MPTRPRARLLALLIAGAWSGPLPAGAAWLQNGTPVALGPSVLTAAPVPDASGGHYVAWYDYPAAEVAVQRIGLDGAPDPTWPATGVRMSTGGTNVNSRPVLVSGAAGSVWVVFPYDGPTGNDLRFQLVRPDGSVDFGPQGYLLADDSVELYGPCAVADGSGGFYAAWSNAFGQIRVQRVDGAGDTIGAEPIRGQLAATPGYTAEVSCGLGTYFYVVWTDFRADQGDIYLQRIDAAGALPFLTPIDGYPVGVATGVQSTPRITTEGFGGDAVVAWFDYRDDTSAQVAKIRLQRMNSGGNRLWGADGRASVLTALYPSGLSIQADYGNGAYVCFAGIDATTLRTSVQITRFDANGIVRVGWPYFSGIELYSAPYVGYYPVLGGLSGDTNGGLYVSYSRPDFDADKAWLARFSPSGVPFGDWPAGGFEIVRADGYRTTPELALTLAGEVVMAWTETSSTPSGGGVFTQRMGADGLSYAHRAQVVALEDIPDDEGGFVRMTLAAAGADSDRGSPRVTGYNLWRRIGPPSPKAAVSPRRIDPAEVSAALEIAREGGGTIDAETAAAAGLPAATWESVGFHPATNDEVYAVVAPTRRDATVNDPALETFVVTVHTEIATLFTSTGEVSAASVDNLPPSAPSSVSASAQGGGILVQWTANTERDLAGYAVYRGATPDFPIGPATRIASLTSVSFLDPGFTFGSHYRVTALDRHGNESTASSPGVITGAEPAGTLTLLRGPRPNPSSGDSRFSLRLAGAGRVRGTVYDLAGRRVRDLLDEFRPAGDQWIDFDGRDDAGAPLARGVYLLRLETPGTVFDRKLILVD